jgi:hypothetical protein
MAYGLFDRWMEYCLHFSIWTTEDAILSSFIQKGRRVSGYWLMWRPIGKNATNRNKAIGHQSEIVEFIDHPKCKTIIQRQQ